MVKKVVEFFQPDSGPLAAHIERCQEILAKNPDAQIAFLIEDDAWHIYANKEDADEATLEWDREWIRERLEWAQQQAAELEDRLKATYRK